MPETKIVNRYHHFSSYLGENPIPGFVLHGHFYTGSFGGGGFWHLEVEGSGYSVLGICTRKVIAKITDNDIFFLTDNSFDLEKVMEAIEEYEKITTNRVNIVKYYDECAEDK